MKEIILAGAILLMTATTIHAQKTDNCNSKLVAVLQHKSQEAEKLRNYYGNGMAYAYQDAMRIVMMECEK